MQAVPAWASVQFSPNPGTDNYLQGVAAISPTDAWSAGYYCRTKCGQNPEDDRSMILHWNGTAWSRVTSPNPGVYDQLRTITAVSATDIWAAGYYYNASFSACGLLLVHWNGTAWSKVSTPFEKACDNVYALYAESANDIWAVGFGTTTKMATLILHWNGSTWSQIPSPSPGATYNILVGVSADSATDAWAAGYYCKSGCTSTPVYRPLILHWNGSTWSQAATPAGTSSQLLNGIEAVSATGAWAVGYTQATGSTLILNWNGTTWSQSSSPNAGPLSQTAFGSPTDGWAVGGAFPLHWNGSTWSQAAFPAPGLGPDAASADGTNDVWAVGSYCSGSGCTSSPNIFRTVTMHWNGTSWSRE